MASALWSVLAGTATWLLMGWDKRRARRAKRRVREATLLRLAWLGGGMGLALGMVVFRHKTRHMRFRATALVSGLLWALPLVWVTTRLVWG